MAYITGDNTLAVCTVILVLTWIGFWAEKTRLGKFAPGLIWIIVLGMVLSNLKITPFSSPVYTFISDYLVAAAIPLLLLKADFATILHSGRKVLLPFFFSVLGVILGAVIGYFILDLGDVGAKAAGVYTAVNIGGIMNFIAVSKSVAMTPAEISAALGAITISSTIGFFALVTIPSLSLAQRWLPSKIINEATERQTEPAAETNKDKPVEMKLTHIAGALALSFALFFVADTVSKALGLGQYNILFSTLFAIILANAMPRQLQKLKGEFELGLLLMYFYLSITGLSTDIFVFINHAFVLVVYGITIVISVFIVLLSFTKLFKIDLAEAITGCGAAIAGPVITVAFVSARGWKSMATPAIVTGVFGYAIANFIGVAITTLLAS